MDRLLSQITIHPVAEVFPPMTDREFTELKKDIEQNGQLQSIWLFKEQIIDGRNRFKACQELGIEPRFTEWFGESEDLTKFVVGLNLHRRHLNESQRAMVAAKLANLENGHRATFANLQSTVTQSDAAEMLQVSPRSVADAKAVQSQGSPELIEKVEKGEIAVSTAAVIAKELPREEQVEVVEQGKQAIQETVREIREKKAEEKAPASQKKLFDKKIMKRKIGAIAFEVEALATAFPETRTECEKVLDLCRNAQDYLGV